MFRGLEATILVERLPTIEYREGLFYITDDFGNGAVMRRCYTPKVYLSSMAGANAAVAKWMAEQRERDDTIVEFERVYPESKTA